MVSAPADSYLVRGGVPCFTNMAFLSELLDWIISKPSRLESLQRRQRLTFHSCVVLGFLGYETISRPAGRDPNEVVKSLLEQEHGVGVGIVHTPCDLWRGYKIWRTQDFASDELETFMDLDVDDALAVELIGNGDAVHIGPTTEVASGTNGVYTLDEEPISEKHHRRVHKRHAMPYAAIVLAEVRARFGVPTRSAANELAVRRYARDIMSKHGLRPTHMSKLLPYVCQTAFVPSDDDIRAASWGSSEAAVARERLFNSLVPRTRE